MRYLFAVVLLVLSFAASSAPNPDLWQYVQEKLFGDRIAVEADPEELHIDGPKRASSGAQVPVTITVNSKRFKKLYLIIDGNPTQHAATFTLTDQTQVTEIMTRIRMETDSFVRVIAEDDNGHLSMSVKAIRASGGCSGYMDSSDPELTKDLGKILYKTKDGYQTTRIKHPMFTGLQKDSINGWYVPEWIIKRVEWYDGALLVLAVDTNISMSQDPYFKFKYQSPVTIIATDTKDNKWSK
jgi:sulfur-oxidizing protein SoxY